MISMIDYEFYSNLTEIDLHEFRAYCQNVSFLPMHSKLILNTSPLKLLEVSYDFIENNLVLMQSDS